MVIDLKDIDKNGDSCDPGSQPNSGKVSVKFVRYEGQAPTTVSGLDSSMTVDQVEGVIARKQGVDKRSMRFVYNGEPLPPNARIGDVISQLGSDAVFETVPDHTMGAGDGMWIPNTIPTHFFPSIQARLARTNYNRLHKELADIKLSKDYGALFKLTIDKAPGKNGTVTLTQTDFLFPTLRLKFRDRWYSFQLILAGYPHYLQVIVVGALPPCPVHGGKHPHIFDNANICWEVETKWGPQMTLFNDVIMMIDRALNKPSHHYGCR